MKIALAVIGGILLIGALVAGGMWLRYMLAAPSGKVQAAGQIQSGSSRIARYEEFFNLCAGVRADEVSLDAQHEQLRQTPSDSFQYNRIQGSVTSMWTTQRSSYTLQASLSLEGISCLTQPRRPISSIGIGNGSSCPLACRSLLLLEEV